MQELATTSIPATLSCLAAAAAAARRHVLKLFAALCTHRAKPPLMAATRCIAVLLPRLRMHYFLSEGATA